MSDEKLTPPRRTRGDAAHMIVKAGLSAIPYAGGAVARFMDYVIQPPLSKRRAAWEISVTEKLNELGDKVEGFNVNDLVDDESFITTYINATRLAISEHRSEKIDAFRNAVLNAALPSSPNDDELALFLSYIDRLTPWHLRLLDYFKTDGHGEYLTLNLPELRGRDTFYGLLVDDLLACGLLHENTERLTSDYLSEYDDDEDQGLKVRKTYDSGRKKSQRTMMSEKIRLKVTRAEITQLGVRFLTFIKSPIPEDPKG